MSRIKQAAAPETVTCGLAQRKSRMFGNAPTGKAAIKQAVTFHLSLARGQEKTSPRRTTMNRFAMTAIAAALAFSVPVFADDTHHPEKPADAKSASAPLAPQVKKMQDNVKKMQPQLDRIAKARTDAERQKAMAEHMQTMQENMAMARGMRAGMMMDCPMMQGGMMGQGGMGMMGKGGMMGGGPGMAGAEDMMAKRMEMMEKRMDMMQMMMQGRMGMPEGVPAKPAN